MTRGKTKLEAEATSKGFDKVAGDAKKVDEALDGVQETTARSTVVTEQATEAQTELNAAESDYIGVLAGISPFLGQLVATMINAAKVVGRLGTSQINLTKATKGAGAAIGKLSGVLKTLAAAGAAFLAIKTLVGTISKLREEAKRATDAIKTQSEALNAEREKVEALEKAYLSAAEARRRFNGETIEEAAQGTAEAQRIAERTGVDAATAATVAGEVSGTGITRQEQEQYTMLRGAGRAEGLDTKLPEHVRLNRVRRDIRRNEEFLANKERQIQEKRARELDDAFRQLTTPGGETAAAEKFVKQFVEPGTDVARVVGLLKQTGLDVEEAKEKAAGPLNVVSRAWASWMNNEELMATLAPTGEIGQSETIAVSRELAAQMQAVATEMRAAVREGKIWGPPKIEQHNVRNTYPDANTMRRNTVNGEGMRTAWEGS